MTYIELQAATHFSFLRGVSSAEALFAAAWALGYEALGITDRNTVGGLVKGLRAERQLREELQLRTELPPEDQVGVRLIAGCRLDLMDGSALLVWPEDRAAWSRLTRLVRTGQGRGGPQKGGKRERFLP